MSNSSFIPAILSLILPTLAACNGGAGGATTSTSDESGTQSSESSSGSVSESDDVGTETGGTSQVGDMVDIPAGDFQMGCDEITVADCVSDELPIHLVSVSGFQIDLTEVTVAAYRECVDAGACTEPGVDDPEFGPDIPRCNWDEAGRDQHPVNCLVRPDAVDYCAFRDLRLPTEAEWEYAARGQTGRLFPWGEADPSCDLANTSLPGPCEDPARTLPVGSNPDGASAFGVEDMGGNLREMVSDWYQSDYYAVSPQADPQGPQFGEIDSLSGEPQLVTRGGGFMTEEEQRLRASHRERTLEQTRSFSTGFRCAKSVP